MAPSASCRCQTHRQCSVQTGAEHLCVMLHGTRDVERECLEMDRNLHSPAPPDAQFAGTMAPLELRIGRLGPTSQGIGRRPGSASATGTASWRWWTTSPPGDVAAFLAALDEVDLCVGRGETVLVHCGAGCGRTGMFSACLLVRHGSTPVEAIRTHRRLRGCGPETPEQVAFVVWYARFLESGGET